MSKTKILIGLAGAAIGSVTTLAGVKIHSYISKKKNAIECDALESVIKEYMKNSGAFTEDECNIYEGILNDIRNNFGSDYRKLLSSLAQKDSDEIKFHLSSVGCVIKKYLFKDNNESNVDDTEHKESEDNNSEVTEESVTDETSKKESDNISNFKEVEDISSDK